MEYNIQKYKFHQKGKDYIVSTGLVDNKIRITCQEDINFDGPFYSNEFSLYDLRAASQFFRITTTPSDALTEINKCIERQKAALKEGINNTIHFLGFLIIGTDNDVFELVLNRDNKPNNFNMLRPPSTGQMDLILNSNYKVDGERIKVAEKKEGELQKIQTLVEEELSITIPEINKLKKITMDIEEENALIRERIKILQKQLEKKKYNISRLKQENDDLKKNNQNLFNYIKTQDNTIRKKQAIQMNAKIEQRPNINHGISAVTSRFEQPSVKTFLSRAGIKPTTENYSHNKNYSYTTTETTESPYIQSEYVQFNQPQIITPTTQYLAPSYSYTPQKDLRNSNYSIISNISYKFPTYRAYLHSTSKGKPIIFKNRVNDPNIDKNTDKNTDKNNEINITNNNDLTGKNKEIPLNQGLVKSKSNINMNKHMVIQNNYNIIELGKGVINNNNLTKNENNITYNNQMPNIIGNNFYGYNSPIGSRLPSPNFGKSVQFWNKNMNNNINQSNRSKSPDFGKSKYKLNY